MPESQRIVGDSASAPGAALVEILKVPPISERGTVPQIAAFFGGAERMRAAVSEMQALLYAS